MIAVCGAIVQSDCMITPQTAIIALRRAAVRPPVAVVIDSTSRMLPGWAAAKGATSEKSSRVYTRVGSEAGEGAAQRVEAERTEVQRVAVERLEVEG
jgi:hypothetical protein